MDQYIFSFSDSWSVGNDIVNDVPCGESSSYIGHDYTAEFATDHIFETRSVILDWVRRVGKENDFAIVISKSASIKGNKMPKCILIWERRGLYKPPPEGHSMQRITGTKKCDCPFKLRGVAQPPDGVMWGLKVDSGFHNHKPAGSFERHEYPSRLTPIQQQLVRGMSSSTAPRKILSFMRQQDSSISARIRSIYNVNVLYKKEQLGGLSSIGAESPEDHWMDSIPLGLVIASTYDVVMHTFNMIASSCLTHLPLSSHSVSFATRKRIAIGHVNGNHFVQVFLYPHFPIPPIIIWWRQNASVEARGWTHPYEAHLQLWYEVMKINPSGQRPQFGRNID
ncbi:hypothetical protein RHMOL_Rhmol10G0222400 [Rhododendron molle]|uniref:Uncharacterized protein n=1 Tax=Rhododendron molle TaxID=49168 RepID=A0ACC0M566_RHOML|nr:hypothetical protein RHMOL_Rhmol10G0222400 [Rhododendron molle]